MVRTLSVVAVFALVLSGCTSAERASLPPLSPAFSPASQTREAPGAKERVPVTVLAQAGPHGFLPDLREAFPHRHMLSRAYERKPLTKGATIFAIAVIYGGAATYRYDEWVGALTVGKNGTVAVPFSAATPGKNEWFLVDFYVNLNGQQGRYIGSLASFVNVSKSLVKLSATPATTLVFQAGLALIYNGLLDAADCLNPTFTSTIAAQIAIHHLAPDPSRGIYTGTTLANFVNAVAPAYERLLQINGGPAATLLTVANDPTDLPDTYLAYNTYSTYYVSNQELHIAGRPCFTSSPAYLPGRYSPPGTKVCATSYSTANGAITVPVYGGSLITGATNNVVPFTGASQKVTGGAPAAKSTVNLTMVPTQISLTTNDPQDWAFGIVPFSALYSYPDPVSGVPVTLNGFPVSGGAIQEAIPINYSHANPAIPVNSWNPWNLPLSNFDICSLIGYDASCSLFNPNATLQLYPGNVNDNGTNAAYFNWQGANGTVISYDSSCSAYAVTPNNGALTLATTTPVLLAPSAFIRIQTTSSCGTPGELAGGSVVTVTATDSSGSVWSGSSFIFGGGSSILLNNSQPFTATSITISATPLAGSPAQIYFSSL